MTKQREYSRYEQQQLKALRDIGTQLGQLNGKLCRIAEKMEAKL